MPKVPDERATGIRHQILALLALFSLASYVLRTNISIAAKFMMPELGLGEIEMGRVFSAFMLGYALFQIPAGLLGDRLGARLVLAGSALLWGVTTLLTGLVPGWLLPAGAAAFASLLVLRFVLGAAEAATYPVAARAVAAWIPFSERTFANATVIAGATLGMTFTPPLVSWLMVSWGWRLTFFVTALLGFAIAGLWWWLSTDHPEQHARVAPAELRVIRAGRPERSAAQVSSWWSLLRNRNLALICTSYFLESFVSFVFIFWFFLYLTDERGFGVLKGGVYASLPYVCAMVMIPSCGYLCDRLARRLGRNGSRRALAIVCLGAAAVLLLVGARVGAPLPAILCLSLAVGFLMSTEGPFWSTTVEVAGEHAGAAGGIMNTAGNLGGVISTALAPVLVQRFGWFETFALCAGLAIVAGLIWLAIRVDETMPMAAGEPVTTA